jgi:hypothetical protein
MGICHLCRENDTGDQIKAGCGHLIFICLDCRAEQDIAAHEKCITCRGGQTPDQMMQEERSWLEQKMDDLFFDDLCLFDEPEEEEEHEQELDYDPYHYDWDLDE